MADRADRRAQRRIGAELPQALRVLRIGDIERIEAAGAGVGASDDDRLPGRGCGVEHVSDLRASVEHEAVRSRVTRIRDLVDAGHDEFRHIGEVLRSCRGQRVPVGIRAVVEAVHVSVVCRDVERPGAVIVRVLEGAVAGVGIVEQRNPDERRGRIDDVAEHGLHGRVGHRIGLDPVAEEHPLVAGLPAQEPDERGAGVHHRLLGQGQKRALRHRGAFVHEEGLLGGRHGRELERLELGRRGGVEHEDVARIGARADLGEQLLVGLPQDDRLALGVFQHRAGNGVESLRLDDPGPGVGLIGGAECEIVLGRDVRARRGRSRRRRVPPRNVGQGVLNCVRKGTRVQREEVRPAPVDGGVPQIVERALLVLLRRRPVAHARGPEADVGRAVLDVREIPG